MDKTPRELKTYFETRFPEGHRPGNHLGYFPGRGKRHGFKSGGKMVVNQLTITEDLDYTPTPCCWGYLFMNRFLVGDLRHEEIHNINKSKTMRIHSITFERLVELLDILDNR